MPTTTFVDGTEAMQTTAVITAHDSKRLGDLSECMEAVRAQSQPPSEIIVSVDQNARLVERLRQTYEPEVMIVSNAGRGLSGSRNTALRHATGDLITFLDDDVLPDHRWLECLSGILEDPAVFAAGGPILPLWYGTPPRWLPREFFWIIGCTYEGQPHDPAELRNLFASNLLFRTDVLRSVGGFSESWGLSTDAIRTGEEGEVFLRIAARFPDMRLTFAPDAAMFHRIYHHRLGLGYALRRSYVEGHSKARLYRSRRTAKARRPTLTKESLFASHLLTSFLPTVLGIRSTGQPILSDAVQLTGAAFLTAAGAAGFAGGLLSRIPPARSLQGDYGSFS